jgi:hypothetical protein
MMNDDDVQRNRGDSGNRGTELQRIRETEETNETKEATPLAASVGTLQEAVRHSLENGCTEKSLFEFARAIKAFEITTSVSLPAGERENAFLLWWQTAAAQLPPGADFDEWRFTFLDIFAHTHAPLGANTLQEAIRRAEASPLPAAASRYNSAKLKRLVAVCFHLQVLAGRAAFFISARSAAQIVGASPVKALTMLNGLMTDQVLISVEKGTPGRKKASRFCFNSPEFAPEQIIANHNLLVVPKLPLRSQGTSDRTPPAKSKRPSTYELSKRKEAVEALLKKIPEDDYERFKERRKLEVKLQRLNEQLAEEREG